MKLPLAVVFASAVALALIGIAVGGNIWIGFHPAAPADRPLGALSVEKRFTLLSQRHSNRCSLEAGSLETVAASGRLQGVCCARLDFAHYKQQLRGLRPYRAAQVIPGDPYDVPMRLAKRLIRFDREIRLDQASQQTYDDAVHLSREHGPAAVTAGAGRPSMAKRST